MSGDDGSYKLSVFRGLVLASCRPSLENDSNTDNNNVYNSKTNSNKNNGNGNRGCLALSNSRCKGVGFGDFGGRGVGLRACDYSQDHPKP